MTVGPVSQSAFLHRMGIRERIHALAQRATHAQAEQLLSAYSRLTSPAEMGESYQCMALLSKPLHAHLTGHTQLIPGFT